MIYILIGVWYTISSLNLRWSVFLLIMLISMTVVPPPPSPISASLNDCSSQTRTKVQGGPIPIVLLKSQNIATKNARKLPRWFIIASWSSSKLNVDSNPNVGRCSETVAERNWDMSILKGTLDITVPVTITDFDLKVVVELSLINMLDFWEIQREHYFKTIYRGSYGYVRAFETPISVQNTIYKHILNTIYTVWKGIRFSMLRMPATTIYLQRHTSKLLNVK